MLDLQSGCWVEITFIEGYEPRCTLSNILYGIMYRFRIVAVNDAGASEPGEPSDPVVIDVPGVQIAPYFVQHLVDTIALEHERVSSSLVFHLFMEESCSFRLTFEFECWELRSLPFSG